MRIVIIVIHVNRGFRNNQIIQYFIFTIYISIFLFRYDIFLVELVEEVTQDCNGRSLEVNHEPVLFRGDEHVLADFKLVFQGVYLGVVFLVLEAALDTEPERALLGNIQAVVYLKQVEIRILESVRDRRIRLGGSYMTHPFGVDRQPRDEQTVYVAGALVNNGLVRERVVHKVPRVTERIYVGLGCREIGDILEMDIRIDAQDEPQVAQAPGHRLHLQYRVDNRGSHAVNRTEVHVLGLHDIRVEPGSEEEVLDIRVAPFLYPLPHAVQVISPVQVVVVGKVHERGRRAV